MPDQVNNTVPTVLAACFFLVAIVFVIRSFYGMRIETKPGADDKKPSPKLEPAKAED